MTTAPDTMLTSLYSSDLSCPSCIGKIEDRLRVLPGVRQASVHVASGRVEIVHDPSLTGVGELVDAVHAAGYEAAPRGF